MPMGMYRLLALAHVVFEFIEPPTGVEACKPPTDNTTLIISIISNAQVSFLMFTPLNSERLKI